MNGFFDKLQRFMAGRNGYDRLCLISFFVYTALVIANIFVHSLIIYIIEWLILGYIIFRMLSRNVYQRQRENMFFVRQKNKIRDIKTHRYIKCKNCKAKLRVKRKKGKHNVRCPKCGKVFETNIRI